jgi:hypothetical protein
MANVPTVNQYPKATYTKAQVQTIQTQRLADGATSCTLTDDATNWILTTVWPGS